jgi:protein-disulfide isomerase
MRGLTEAAIAASMILAVACAKSEEPAKADPAPSASAPVASVASPAPSASAAPSASVAVPNVDAGAYLAFFPDAGFTPREANELVDLLGALDAPCPSTAVSLGTCLSEHRACDDCAVAARFVSMGVHAGWPTPYVRMAYAGRFDPKRTPIDLPADGSPAKGPATAPVVITEFGSYLCPHCAAEAPKLEALLKAHPKDLRLVFKPAWSPSNPVSERVTRAAMAAGAQGKFWEMHAALFANQPKFDDSDIEGYAKSVGVDPTKLKADMQSAATTERLAKDLAAAKTAHVDSLPSLWVNGRPLHAFEDLDARIEFEIDAAKSKATKKK